LDNLYLYCKPAPYQSEGQVMVKIKKELNPVPK